MLWTMEYDLCLSDIRALSINRKQLYQYVNEKYPKLFTTGDVVSGNTKSFLELVDGSFCKTICPSWLRNIVRETLW